MSLDDKIVLVTGGASGIGHATVTRLARDGAHVVVADRQVELSNKVVAEVTQAGGSAEGASGRAEITRSLLASSIDRFLPDRYKRDANIARRDAQGFKHLGYHGTKYSSDFDVIDPFRPGRDFGFHLALGDPGAANSRLGYKTNKEKLKHVLDMAHYIMFGGLFPTSREPSELDRILPVAVRANRTIRLPDMGYWASPKDWQNNYGIYVRRHRSLLEKDFPDHIKIHDAVERYIRDQRVDRSSNVTLAKEHHFSRYIANELEKLGYDGVTYENLVEDPGSQSMFVWKPEQVRSAFDLFHEKAKGEAGLNASAKYVLEEVRERLNKEAKARGLNIMYSMGDAETGRLIRRDLGDFDTNEFGYRAMADAMGRAAPQGEPSISATRWQSAVDNPNAPKKGEKVLFVGDEPAGLVTMYQDAGDSITITDIAVLEGLQRQGHGARLIADLLREFPNTVFRTNMRTGAGKALLAPFDDGTGALRLPANIMYSMGDDDKIVKFPSRQQYLMEGVPIEYSPRERANYLDLIEVPALRTAWDQVHDQPVIDVPVGQLLATQPDVDSGQVGIVRELLSSSSKEVASKFPTGYRWNGRVYIEDGHHRAAAYAMDRQTVPMRVFDLDQYIAENKVDIPKQEPPSVARPPRPRLMFSMPALRDVAARHFAMLAEDVKPGDKHPGPIIAFHGTRANFSDKFDPKLARHIGHHFGTQEQANWFVMPMGSQVPENFPKLEKKLSVYNETGFSPGDISAVYRLQDRVNELNNRLAKYLGYDNGVFVQRFLDAIMDTGYLQSVSAGRDYIEEVFSRFQSVRNDAISLIRSEAPNILDTIGDAPTINQIAAGIMALRNRSIGNDLLYSRITELDARFAQLNAEFGRAERLKQLYDSGEIDRFNSLLSERNKEYDLLRRISDAENVLGGVGSGARIFPVLLNFKNVFEIKDLGNWSPNDIRKEIIESYTMALNSAYATGKMENFHIPFWNLYLEDIAELGIKPPRVVQEIERLVRESIVPEFKTREEVRNWLVDQGFDGIRYQNIVEGEGYSYIALKSNTVRSLTTSEIMYSFARDSGMPEAGAAQRRADLEADLAEIEMRFQASGGDERERLHARRAALLNAQATEQLTEDVSSWRNPRGQSDPAKAWLLLHESTGREGGKNDVATLHNVIRDTAMRPLAQAIWHFRKGAITGDFRRRFQALRGDATDVLRAAAGEQVNNPMAQQFGQAWLEVAEYLRQRFNAAGGDIGHLVDWIAPQYHNAQALLNAGREVWVEAITERLDWDRILRPDGQPIPEGERRSFLNDIWYNITTEGAPEQAAPYAPGYQGMGALYRRHRDHRILHFKSVDDFLAYNREFGGGDIMASMIGHIDRLSKDIAALERFGANPELVRERMKTHLINWAKRQRSAMSLYDELEDRVGRLRQQLTNLPSSMQAIMDEIGNIHSDIDRLRAAGSARNADAIQALNERLFDAHQRLREVTSEQVQTNQQQELWQEMSALLDEMSQIDLYPVMSRNPTVYVNRMLGRADEIWKLYRGHTNTPVDSTIAGFLSGARNFVMAATLPGASISSISDITTQLAARAFIGMPVVNQLSSWIRAFGPADRQLALQLGLGLDQAQMAFAERARYVGTFSTQSLMGYLNDRTHALSFLTPMTQAQKTAFNIDFQRWMATARETSWRDLPGETRRMLERHGYSPAEWADLQAVAPEQTRLGPMLTHGAVEEALGTDAADRYMIMMARERAQAVLDATYRGRSAFISESRPGTVPGEFLRSIAMIKSFSTSYALQIIGRAYDAYLEGNRSSLAAYLTSIFVGGTLMGAVAMQLKNIAYGRDPDDMSDPGFWTRAFMQSGGLGIFGDFVGSSVNRFGGGLAQTAMGPLAGRASGILDLTAGNLLQYGMDEKTNFGREVAQRLRENTPTLPFYVRTAYERILIDNLQRVLDEDADRSFRARKKALDKRSGQTYYWPPGENAPREIDWGAMFGNGAR
ncbi:MAG: SDR family NAD(P)-dependent oxidoreductase [Euryarchaeota archaeon]|nr:SDR family NAD(P)-dependent oxidoreductase [Euryarchaeota archaeon]NDB93550.1 SDR family NAD(P)-dependent oxidoreductase [Euryarchaeota archaeon]